MVVALRIGVSPRLSARWPWNTERPSAVSRSDVDTRRPDGRWSRPTKRRHDAERADDARRDVDDRHTDAIQSSAPEPVTDMSPDIPWTTWSRPASSFSGPTMPKPLTDPTTSRDSAPSAGSGVKSSFSSVPSLKFSTRTSAPSNQALEDSRALGGVEVDDRPNACCD